MEIRLIAKNKPENWLKIKKADMVQTNRRRDRVPRRPEPRSLTHRSSCQSRLSTQQAVMLASTSPTRHGDHRSDELTRQRRIPSFELSRGIFSTKKKKRKKLSRGFFFLNFIYASPKKKKKSLTYSKI